MHSNLIIHISEVNISRESGMGRVEYYWKQAFENAGYDFIHIGPKEAGPLRHPALFPYKAYLYYKKLNILPKAFIVHEPASGHFVKKGIPCFVESHGIERRYWEAQLNGSVPPENNHPISFKTKLLFPLWRLSGCNKGIKKAEKLLLINSDDSEYAKIKYRRNEEDILIFKNGIWPLTEINNVTYPNFTILFNGSWIGRKGTETLIRAAWLLYKKGLLIHYLLIGTGKGAAPILNEWPQELHPYIKIVPHFKPEDELGFLACAALFVLPSYAEGQPLCLLQAMAAGKCCIATNCCGQKDILEHGKTGFLFPIGDENTLSLLITDCFSNPAMMKQIGESARASTINRTWKNVSNEVVNYVTDNLSV